jgi:hypothetical protein
MRLDFGVVVLILASLAWVSPVQAQSEPASIAARLPLEVTEVVTGGTWVEGSASGTYRTVTVFTAAPTETVDVFLQWIGSRSPVDPLQILSSLPLREFNELKLTSASVTLDDEAEGRVKITIAGQDGNARAAAPITFIATKPGQYTVGVPEPATEAK